ncbi:MAG: hydroxyacid dehydrogenase [Dehalococcoidia bacterium]|nr:hydroxyacid dehydrogenase [Dehalococcoidia bacterium]
MREWPRTKVVLFEVQPWERQFLPPETPRLDLTAVPELLTSATLAQARDAEVVSVFIRSQITRTVLSELPRLRLIATRSTGYDHIDLQACDERGVTVSNVPSYGENTVAEHTFALILALSRNTHRAYQRTVQGNFALEGLEGFDLKGKTLGVVGAGNIGLHVIRIAKGFAMEVLSYDVRQDHLLSEVLGFQYVPLEELLRRSDIVTLHAPLMRETYHLMNERTLRMMKRGALLINTARGALVDTNALIQALDQGIVGGAGLDVLEGEELIQEESQLLTDGVAEDKLRVLLQNHILMRRPNVVITPHIGFFSREALQRIIEATIENVEAWLDGSPRNVVNRPQPAGEAAASGS